MHLCSNWTYAYNDSDMKENKQIEELITEIAWDLWQTESRPKELKSKYDSLKKEIDSEFYELIVEKHKFIKQKSLELKKLTKEYERNR